MQATNFMYDGVLLSDFGFVVCDFSNSGDLANVSGGSVITFNKISHHYGRRFSLSNISYDECVTTTFDICKNPEIYGDEMEISDTEIRTLFKWLNRKEFIKMYFIDDCSSGQDADCYYDASFNIEKLIIDGKTYGLRLNMETNRPFGYGSVRTVNFSADGDSGSRYEVEYVSDEIGSVTPDITITCISAGDLTIENVTNGSIMVLKNCSAGEKIRIDGFTHQITSNLDSHDVVDDYSFSFVRLVNTYTNTINVIAVSLQCDIEIKYTPVIKLIM